MTITNWKKAPFYIASKAKHRSMWRILKIAGMPINSRWIEVEDKYTNDPEGLDFVELWEMCVADVQQAEYLVCYVEPGEVLKGALVELGIALGLEKPVILVGPIEAYGEQGTWHNHPFVYHADATEIETAIAEYFEEPRR